MIDSLQASNLSSLPQVRHAFFTSQGGVSEGIYESLNAGLSSKDSPANVRENRRRMAEHLGVTPENLLSGYQLHTPDVKTVVAPWLPEERPHVDAMVTKERGIALGILTADCVPVLFADPEHNVIGAAHAGWRGAIGGVLENTLIAMEKIGASRSKIYAALGPCIWQDSYDVGPEFPAPFLQEDFKHQRFFRPGADDDHFQFDLPGYVVEKLTALGLASVALSPANTFADEKRFFSYRRNCVQKGINTVASLLSAIVLA